MLRSQLIKAIADKFPQLSATEAAAAVEEFFLLISEHLANDGRVELRDFGTFFTFTSDGRDGRNPRTGAFVAIPSKRYVRFRPGKNLAKIVSDQSSR